MVRCSCSKNGSTRRGVDVDYCSLHLPSHSYPPSLGRVSTTLAKQNNLSAAPKEAQPHKTIPSQLQVFCTWNKCGVPPGGDRGEAASSQWVLLIRRGPSSASLCVSPLGGCNYEGEQTSMSRGKCTHAQWRAKGSTSQRRSGAGRERSRVGRGGGTREGAGGWWCRG